MIRHGVTWGPACITSSGCTNLACLHGVSDLACVQLLRYKVTFFILLVNNQGPVIKAWWGECWVKWAVVMQGTVNNGDVVRLRHRVTPVTLIEDGVVTWSSVFLKGSVSVRTGAREPLLIYGVWAYFAGVGNKPCKKSLLPLNLRGVDYHYSSVAV